MNSSTVMPTWLVIGIAVATPLLTFLGAMAGNLVTRRGALELETRSRREQVLSHLKWAAELAVSPDVRRADLGVRELQALARPSLLDAAERSFIEAAMEAVYAEPAAALHEAAANGAGDATDDSSGDARTGADDSPDRDVRLTQREE